MKKLVIGLVIGVLTLTGQSASADARVAVLHLAPFAADVEDTAVNILVNGDTTFENVKFKDFVEYTSLPAGEYTIDIVPVGQNDPAISGTFNLADGMDYSLFATGDGVNQALSLEALVDDNTAPMAGNLKVRIVHAAPFAAELAATEVSIRTAGGDLVGGLEGVPYLGASGYLELPADTYHLKVASNDGKVNYIDISPVALPAGAILTVFAIGDGANQPLGVLAYPLGELSVQPPVDNSANGWWGIQEGSGQGFILQPMPSQNRLVGTWYTYDEAGNPVFLTFDSCLSDEGGVCSTPGGFDNFMAETVLYMSTGGGSAEDLEVETVPIGMIEFEILGCSDAMATVTLDGGLPEMYTGKRLTRPLPCTYPSE